MLIRLWPLHNIAITCSPRGALNECAAFNLLPSFLSLLFSLLERRCKLPKASSFGLWLGSSTWHVTATIRAQWATDNHDGATAMRRDAGWQVSQLAKMVGSSKPFNRGVPSRVLARILNAIYAIKFPRHCGAPLPFSLQNQ